MTLPVNDLSLVFICRFCTRMEEMWDKGEKVCHLVCGGPKKGMAFPLYRGPLTLTFIQDHCFVCGESAEVGIQIGIGRNLGVCHEHFSLAGINADDQGR